MFGQSCANQSGTRRATGWVWFAVVALWTSSSGAQELSVFLEAAKRHNFDARESAAFALQRAAEASQTTAGLYPSLTAQGLYTRNQFAAEVVAPVTPGAPPENITILPRNQLDAFFTVDVPLIDLTQWALIRSNNALAEAARQQEGATDINVMGAVVQAYYDLVGAQALVKASQQSIDATEVFVARTEERVAAGVASPVDQARAISELSIKRQTLASAEQAAAVGARTLRTLTSIEPKELIAPPTDSLRAEVPPETWLARFDQIPAVRAADADAKAARIRADSAWTVFVPTLSGQFVERLTNATGFANASAFYTATLNITERLDIAAFSAARAQKAAASVVEVRAERIRQNVRDTIYSNWQRVHALIAGAKAARAAKEANEVAVRILRERYDAGTASSLELAQADRDLFTAIAQVIRAEADLATARAYLRLSAGFRWDEPGPVEVAR